MKILKIYFIQKPSFPIHQVRNPGHKVGVLDQSEAIKMNLNSTGNHAIPVAASLIDAHAGALGMLAIK